MEGAFLHYNCFTLVAFLYLIVISELSTTESKSVTAASAAAVAAAPLPIKADVTASINDNTNFFYYLHGSRPSSVSNSGNSQFLTSSYSSMSSSSSSPSTSRTLSSFSQLSTNTSAKLLDKPFPHASSPSKSQTRRLLVKNKSSHAKNTNIDDNIFHILTNYNNNNNSKYNYSSSSSPSSNVPSTYLSSTLASSFYWDVKQENGSNRISSFKGNRPHQQQQQQRGSNANGIINNDYDQMEKKLTMSFEERKNNSFNSSKNKPVVLKQTPPPPPAAVKSSPRYGLHVDRLLKQKVAKTADAVGPFPVAYLISSHYELGSKLGDTEGGGGVGGSGSSSSRGGGGGSVAGITPRKNIRPNSASRNNDDVLRLSNSVLDEEADDDDGEVHVSNVQELKIPLRNDDERISEISPYFTTVLPEAAAMSATTSGSSSSSKDLEATSSSSDDDTTNATTDEGKLYNQTAGTVPLRGKCNDTMRCFGEHVECRLDICKCQLGYLPRIDNGELCGEASAHHVEVPTTDPTMIGVVVGLALMSVTLCIVLRLFAKARFRENRTIFNTPNPRLMNVSLLKGSKTLLRGNSAGQRSRRGSQVSMNSGQIEGQSPENTAPDGNGTSTTAAAGSSSHPHRIKPSRTLSTDTTNLEGTPTSSRPIPSGNRSKFRQDSVASNV